MKNVILFLRALSREDLKTKPGICKAVLIYKDCEKSMSFVRDNVTKEDIIIYTMIQAIKMLKEKCEIFVISEYRIKKDKGNKLYKELIELMHAGGHKVYFEASDEKARKRICAFDITEYSRYMQRCGI